MQLRAPFTRLLILALFAVLSLLIAGLHFSPITTNLTDALKSRLTSAKTQAPLGSDTSRTVIRCSTATVSNVAVATGWHPADSQIGPFSTGTIEEPPMNYTRGLAMARLASDDVSWIDEANLDVQKYIYVVDDKQAPLSTPENKGNEAMGYLTYIIDHYDSLPDITLFMHPHRFADHNDPILERDAVEIIRRLNSDQVTRNGYVNLNCDQHWGCPSVFRFGLRPVFGDALLDIHSRMFPEREEPWKIATPCCAQFAVSRDRIRSSSRAQYVSYRQWILQTELNDYNSGRVWEYLWHLIFTGEDVHCPGELGCYCANYNICFRGHYELKLWTAMQLRNDEIQKRRDKIDALIQAGLGDSQTLRNEDQMLRTESQELVQNQQIMRVAAIERGSDPRIRAEVLEQDETVGHG